ncbi:MAG TPA: VOC family protein [Pseudomonadales bacterium]|nr:VOC family protein [Pseudomonadales bacterium]
MSSLRINHMELTLPPGTLARDKDNINAFYADVFGFEGIEVPMVKLDCPKYLLRFDKDASQFLFLTEEKDALVSKSFDHIGLVVDSRSIVDEALQKCKRWQAKDPRVEIMDVQDMDAGMLNNHSFYVRYILPLWIELQALEYKPEFEPAKKWRYT